MTLIGQIRVDRLKDLSSKMWKTDLDSDKSCEYLFDVVGTIKHFNEISSVLVLKEPIEYSLLRDVFKAQQDILQVFSNEIKNIQEMTDDVIQCEGPVVTYFHDNTVLSSLHIAIPDEMVDELGTFPIGSTMKVKCALGYCSINRQLCLTAQELDIISSVRLVVE